MNKNRALIISTLLFISISAEDDNGLLSSNHSMTSAKEEQIKRLREAEDDCYERLNQTEIMEEPHCPMIWDSALCWPSTPRGTTAELHCPNYVHGFNHKALAYKICTPNGTWYYNEKTGNAWTDYSHCSIKNPDEFNQNLIPHIANFRIISRVGYSVSFATLLCAFLILTFVKRLRCPRNNLHLQLFASFMIRSFMFLIKSLFVFTQTTADSSIAQADQPSSLFFANYDEQTSIGWSRSEIQIFSCKIFTTIWQYSLVANYNWILMEGLYLHNLIFLHIFNDNSSIFKYIIIGWGMPVVFIIPWVVIRALYEDTLCWTTNQNKGIFWIIRVPITAAIILNFIFFINITRVLFMKMFSSSAVNYARQYRYRTWFKSTLVLVPLFGVHYMVLLVFSSFSAISYDVFEIIWLYIDLLFSSFQGCVVALLYCFCNGEVQQELRKLWQAWRSSRSSNSLHSHHSNHSTTHQSYLTQSLTYLSRGRNSLLSTTDNVIPRKNVHNTRSRSPSPSKNQVSASNTLISQTNGQKVLLESDKSSARLLSERLNNSNIDCFTESNNESIM